MDNKIANDDYFQSNSSIAITNFIEEISKIGNETWDRLEKVFSLTSSLNISIPVSAVVAALGVLIGNPFLFLSGFGYFSYCFINRDSKKKDVLNEVAGHLVVKILNETRVDENIEIKHEEILNKTQVDEDEKITFEDLINAEYNLSLEKKFNNFFSKLVRKLPFKKHTAYEIAAIITGLGNIFGGVIQFLSNIIGVPFSSALITISNLALVTLPFSVALIVISQRKKFLNWYEYQAPKNEVQ